MAKKQSGLVEVCVDDLAYDGDSNEPTILEIAGRGYIGKIIFPKASREASRKRHYNILRKYRGRK